MGLGAWNPLSQGAALTTHFSLFSLTSEGRVLVHFGGSLTGAEEEGVLVPVREHC